jgi:hypothetical protein
VIGEAGRKLALIAVEKKKIDIRAMIELSTSEFAKGQNGEFGTGRTVAALQFRIPVFEYATDANLRDPRKLRCGFFKWSYSRKFPKGDSRHLAALPKTKRSKIPRRD